MASKGAMVELAVIAHQLWCEQMAALSWQRGPDYDECRRIHDALVPFQDLGRHDQRRAIRAVECAEIADRLARLIDHQRGPDRELTIEEMRVGFAVAIVGSPGEEPPDERGEVESWETDDEGELRLVRVRWPDGEVSEHHPVARELRRV